MFEKEAKERARDFTDNKEIQMFYVCGFLDGADFADKELKEKWKVKFDDSNRNWNELVTDWVKDLERENTELKEKLAGAERTRDNLIQIGFPTFQSCKEYADKMNYAKVIIQDLLNNSDEYARQRAIDFLKEE